MAKPPQIHSRDERPPKGRLRQNVESLGVALLLALVVRSSVVEAFWVPSGSMLPTIQIGDHLFVNKMAYGLRLPLLGTKLINFGVLHRDDIVVFISPNDSSTDLIKRVIATEGDTVEIRQKKLYVNGQEVPDAHAHFVDARAGAVPRDNFGPVTVPPGKFFVMGDNRDQSYDSRYWGFADVNAIKGKATFIYWSWDSDAHWPRWSRLGHMLE
ncbi:MAG TPA: signal peptidase I [Candidatus Binatia bacterium]|nr:signal peptidase I [Candidatus Binatia bacterium]